MHRDCFSTYHPLVNLLYFALVLVPTMFLMHPATLLISLSCALAYAISLQGFGAVWRRAGYLLPMLLMAAILNPAFNHQGSTILTYLPTGNPLTLESVLYGLAAAGMLGAVVVWFSCWSAVMTTDKLLYLFGRMLPALSLLLSMTLRFVPRFARQLRAVTLAQRCLGRDVSSGPLLSRLRTAAAILSITVTWALEHAIRTADSMKGRGYGLPGRTAFSLYTLESRDELALGWLILCGGYLLYGWAGGYLTWYYYPLVGGTISPSFLLAYLALCLTPVILQRKEVRAWKRLTSKI